MVFGRFAALACLGSALLTAQTHPALKVDRMIPGLDALLIATDPAGDVYIAGRTNDPNFHVPANAFQPENRGGNCQTSFGSSLCQDVVVAKFRASDGAMTAATFLGGLTDDMPTALVVDSGGFVYIAGNASRGFPTTEGAFRRTTNRPSTGSVTKLNPSLTAAEFSTLLGGTRNNDRITAIAVDRSGTVYVTGSADSSDFPTTEGAFRRIYAAGVIFIARLNGAGTALLASSFLGIGTPNGVAVDAVGTVVVAGTTTNRTFPSSPDGLQPRLAGPVSVTYSDGFISRFNSDLTRLINSTYFGGSQNDSIVDVEMDGTGNAYVAGTSFSRDFPLTFADAGIGDSGTAFLAKVGSSGNLAFARAIRGNGATSALGVDSVFDGTIAVTGFSSGTHFPTTAGAIRRCVPSTNRTSPVPFYTRLQPNGDYAYSTLFHDSITESRQWLSAAARDLLMIGFIPPANVQFGSPDPPIYTFRRFDVSAPAAGRIDCVVNAATYAPGSVSGGMIVTIFGSKLGPAVGAGAAVENGTVTTSNAGVRVTFDGVPAPILYAREDQVNAIVPFSVEGKARTQMVVEFNGAPAASESLLVRSTQPGIFRLGSTEYAVVLNEDGTVNTTSNPATPGSLLAFWITGFGPYNRSIADGLIMGNELAQSRVPVAVTIGGQPAEVLYGGSAPGMVAGVSQVNVRIPAGVAVSLRTSVTLTIGTDVAQNIAFIALK